MKEPYWITVREIIAIHSALIREFGGIDGERAGGRELIESALARPRQRFAYDSTATLFDLAAAYLFGLIKNHGFLDGNKRVAFAVASTFLERNGFELQAGEVEAYRIVLMTAEGETAENELGKWFTKESKKVRRT